MKSLNSILLIISLFTVIQSTSQELCFNPANDNRYEVMETCQDFGVMDVNDDGHLDVIVSGGSMMSIHLGNGDGTFDPFYTSAPGTNNHMELVDFDDDSDMDMYSYGFGNLVAGINNGDGTFAWHGYLGITLVDGLFSEMAVGDVTGDGQPDVVVNDSGDAKLYVYEMDATGVPVSSFSIDTPDQPYSPAVGDLNNDGFADIVCALGSSENVAIYFSNGDGTFFEFFTDSGITVPSGYSKVVIADFNDDDLEDIGVSAAAAFYEILNTDNSTFAAPVNVFMGTYCSGFKTGDWDGDNDLDVAWSNDSNGGITVNLNNGDGTFPANGFALYSSNGQAVDLAAADFNEDGNQDIIVANGFDGHFAFLFGWGDGHFGTKSLITKPNPSGMATGDLDNDGDIDIISTSPGAVDNTFIALNLNNGDGSFANTTFIPTMNGAGECVTGLFNADQNIDIVIHTPYGYVFHFGNGDGTFDPYVSFETNNMNEGGDRTCITGDFNNDGSLDVAGSRPGANTVSVIYGDGLGDFSAPTLLSGSGYPRTLMSADYNNDDQDDIIVCSNTTDEVWIYFSEGNATFSTPLILSTPGAPEGLTAFDVNEDNITDLIVASPNLNKIYTFISNNDGTFQSALQTDIPTGSNASRLDHADLNMDGFDDIVAALYQEDAAGVFFGNGDGTFDSAVLYEADQSPKEIIMEDFNDDGTSDIATLNSGTYNISVVLNNAAFINASGELAFCYGDSVILTVSNGYSYAWSNGETSQSITVSENGEYQCMITNQAGDCTLVTPSVSVEVFQGQAVTLELDSTLVCTENGSFNLSGGQPFGGLYSGPGVTANVFDPIAVGPGTYDITYDYSDIGECTVGSATDQITVDICDLVFEHDESILIYPNITSDKITMITAAPYSYVVYDVNGRQILNDKSFQNQTDLLLNTFPSGMYFIKIQTPKTEASYKIQKVD